MFAHVLRAKPRLLIPLAHMMRSTTWLLRGLLGAVLGMLAAGYLAFATPAQAQRICIPGGLCNAYVQENYRSVSLSWSDIGTHDIYQVWWAADGQAEQQIETTDRMFTLFDFQRGAHYTFKLRGCTTVFTSNFCDDWWTLDITLLPFALYGEVLNKYNALGREHSFLGLPITHTTKTPDGYGRYSHFEHGSIYWTAETGAHVVHGAIRDKWASLGWGQGFLGYPTTDELVTPDERGRYNHFERGSIYWTAETGAHVVNGAIRDKWGELGWEWGALGYPVSDPQPTAGGGDAQNFQGGSIIFDSVSQQYKVVYGTPDQRSRVYLPLVATP